MKFLHTVDLLRLTPESWTYDTLTVSPPPEAQHRVAYLRRMGEVLRYGAEAAYENHKGVLVGTDHRLIFAGVKGVFRKKVRDLVIDYEDIRGMEVRERLLLDDLVLDLQEGESFRLNVNSASDVRDQYERVVHERRELGELLTALMEVLDEHERTLWRRRNQLVIRDPYGIEDVSQWEKELDHFLKAVIGSAIENAPKRLDLNEVRQEIERRVAALDAWGAADSVDLDRLTGVEFEGHCITLLQRDGWDARGTAASTDHGADIVAIRDGTVMVVQCKRYEEPVGNGAVQEALAGKAYHDADIAAVVTNSSYTPAARQLAGKADVRLLHVSDLALTRAESEKAESSGNVSKLSPPESEPDQCLPIEFQRTDFTVDDLGTWPIDRLLDFLEGDEIRAARKAAADLEESGEEWCPPSLYVREKENRILHLMTGPKGEWGISHM